MTRPEKVILGLEKLAVAAGYTLRVYIERPNDVWLIKFVAGPATIATTLDLFQRQPSVVFDPFGEELIKRSNL